MKVNGQLIQCLYHRDIQWKQNNNAWRRCLTQPSCEWSIQPQSPLAVQHLSFPQTHGRQVTSSPGSQLIKILSLRSGQLIRTQQPPDPDVGVEQKIHCRALNAMVSSIVSSGSTTSTPVPRSDSHGRCCPAFPGATGVSRATGLPSRVISTSSPLLSTWRSNSRQCS